jgi:hypothetical protein
MQFGMIFDLRHPEPPQSVEEAVAIVRKWAALQSVDIPRDIEPTITRNEAKPDDWRTYPTLGVSFQWENPPSPD